MQKQKRKKSGRPTKDTTETRQKIEEATALDASIEEVAFYANISKETYYQIIKKDKAFSDRLEALRNKPVLKARQTFIQALNDPQYAVRYLEKKRKKEFGNDSQTINIGVSISGIISQLDGNIVNGRQTKAIRSGMAAISSLPDNEQEEAESIIHPEQSAESI